MKIRQQLVVSRDRTYGGTNPALGVVVHETGNRARGATAAAHADLQSSGNVREASWHWTVDDTEAVQSYPHDIRCWPAGDGENGEGNLTRIAVEVCVNEDGDYDKALANAAELVAMIRAEEGIPAENVDQHHAHSGKDCPTILRSRGPAAWAAFVASTEPREVPVSFVSPAQGRVTSHWGPRERHPVTGIAGFHRGIDIAPPTPGQRGVRVYACYGGTVRGVVTGRPNRDKRPNPWTGTWNTGNGVLIDSGNGSQWYGHLETIVVAPGQKVEPGTYLGTMGDSGNVTGVHLHLEMWNGRTSGGGSGAGNTRDPRIDFARYGVTPGSAPVLPKNPSSIREDWLDMASLDEVRAIVREELRHIGDRSEKTNQAVGRLDLAVPRIATAVNALATAAQVGEVKAAVADVKGDTRRLEHVADRSEKTNQAVGRLELVLPRIAEKVGAPASISAADIAAAIPRDLAQQVANELAARLTRKD